MKIEHLGETFVLDPDRALAWPRRRTLIVADVHLGKDAAFRRAGLPVPQGHVRRDLDRLAALVRAHDAERLLVLGDLFHAPPLADEPWFDDVDGFRRNHAALDVQLVRGNHDRGIGRALVRWSVRDCDESLEPPVLFSHEPRDDPRAYVLAGHVHPVLRLRTGFDRARFPVFWFRSAYGVLPSFGGFTGGYEIAPGADDRLVAVTPDGLIDVARARM